MARNSQYLGYVMCHESYISVLIEAWLSISSEPGPERLADAMWRIARRGISASSNQQPDVKTCRTESSKCSELICCHALKSLPFALLPFLPPANCAYCVCRRWSETNLRLLLLCVCFGYRFDKTAIYTELQEEHRRCFSVHFGLKQRMCKSLRASITHLTSKWKPSVHNELTVHCFGTVQVEPDFSRYIPTDLTL